MATPEAEASRAAQLATGEILTDPNWRQVRDPEGRWLVGLVVGKAGPNESVVYLKGLFAHEGENRPPEHEGAVFDRTSKSNFHQKIEHLTLKASAGYAIHSLVVSEAGMLYGLRLRFGRHQNGQFLAGDTYESRWLGTYGHPEAIQVGGNRPATGYAYRENGSHILALRLLFDEESPAKRAASVQPENSQDSEGSEP